MTKKSTTKSAEENNAAPEPQLYVFLKRSAYKAMIPSEREIIEVSEDPYAPDAPRRTMDHLSQADINRLIMRGVIAKDK